MSWASHLATLHGLAEAAPPSADATAPAQQQQQMGAATATEDAAQRPTGGASPLMEPQDEHAETRRKWTALQRSIAVRAVLHDGQTPFRLPVEDPTFCAMGHAADAAWQPPVYDASATTPPPLRIVAGVDISFVPHSNLAVASVAILSFPSLTLLDTMMMHCEMKLPYICTFLAFREVPAIEALLDQLQATKPHLYPQLLFVDGNGYHHPRHCGVACHLGVVRNLPTIGIAKDFLAVQGLTKAVVEGGLLASKQRMMALSTMGCPLWGHAALTGNSSKNPIYISPGHLISFASAAALTWMVAKNRIPEPIRQADLLSRAYIREHFGTQATAGGATEAVSVRMAAVPAAKPIGRPAHQ